MVQSSGHVSNRYSTDESSRLNRGKKIRKGDYDFSRIMKKELASSKRTEPMHKQLRPELGA